MPFCDMHTHTVFSFDGENFVSSLCSDALKENIRAVAMTEHMDFFDGRDYAYYGLFEENRYKAVLKARALYPSIEIFYGIELGQPHYDPLGTADFLKGRSFDIILGSIHDLRGGRTIYSLRCRDMKECDRIMEEYFYEIGLMLEAFDFDVLAHLDYPARVFPCMGKEASLKRYDGLILPILEKCAGKGVALEINTAGTDKWLGRPGPDIWVLEAFKKAGGERVTMGSDSHRPGCCGRGFKEAESMLREAGLAGCLVYYKGRRALPWVI